MNQLRERELFAQTPPERLPVAAFNEYRAHCDQTSDAFRRIGLLGRDSYLRAAGDPRTVFYEVDGHAMPALVPIEYEGRYSSARCRSLTGKNMVMLLTAPLADVQRGLLRAVGVRQPGQHPDFAVVVEQFIPVDAGRPDQRERDDVVAGLAALGEFDQHEFVHPALQRVDLHRAAWMGMYDFSLTSAASAQPRTDASPYAKVVSAWHHMRSELQRPALPDENCDETLLFTSEQLAEHPEIVDGLWAISQVGFGEVLGAHHPVSMEVTKQFFVDHISTPGMLTCVRYRQGRPVCFGFIALSMDENPWLDLDCSLLSRELADARAEGEVLVHFFELISNGAEGLGLSKDILGLFLAIAARTGDDYRVSFESTNLSGTYIPGIATKQIEQTPGLHLRTPVRMLGKLSYWYLTRRR